MKTILLELRKELASQADPHIRASAQKFHKNEILSYGIKTPKLRKIIATYYQQVKKENNGAVLRGCEELLKSGYQEEAFIAFDWSYRIRKKYTVKDFATFERWVKNYIDSWSKCDDLCVHTISYFVASYPKQTIPKVKQWSKAKNMWVRRAAAVAFITTVKKNGISFYGTQANLQHIFDVAKNLMPSSEDLVQKGYGWMLKAASVLHQKPVYDFVLQHEKEMSRTAFRYALEKMPKEWRVQAMKSAKV